MADTATALKCWRCGKLLAERAEKVEIECPRCHARNQVGY
jgi:phage FluMu protein Com